MAGKDEEDLIIDEQLGNYFETLPEKQRKLWLASEVYNA